MHSIFSSGQCTDCFGGVTLGNLLVRMPGQNTELWFDKWLTGLLVRTHL